LPCGNVVFRIAAPSLCWAHIEIMTGTIKVIFSQEKTFPSSKLVKTNVNKMQKQNLMMLKRSLF